MVRYYEDEKFYQRIALTGNQKSLYSSMMHKFMEKDYDETENFPKTLEIGSDQGQHRSFVKHQYTEYFECDLHLPKKQTLDKRVRNVIGDIRNLPFEDNEFDRVIVTCVLHHLSSPSVAINEIIRVTKFGGHINILIPREPSILYFMVRNFLMYLKHKKVRNVFLFHKAHKQQHIGNYKTIIKSIKINHKLKIIRLRRLPNIEPTILYCYSMIKTETHG